MNNPNRRRIWTFSVPQYLIQTDQSKGPVKRRTSYICGTLSWILRMENSNRTNLPRLFPDLQMVITNTFRHTWDRPRFRAVFFTNEIMTPEVYGLIYGWIADKLEEAGYWVDRKDKRRKPSVRSNMRPSGLDWSKSYPTSLFYLPCQAENPQDSFFHEHIEGRHPLNPSTWIENSAIPLRQHLSHLTHLVTKHRRLTGRQLNRL